MSWGICKSSIPMPRPLVADLRRKRLRNDLPTNGGESCGRNILTTRIPFTIGPAAKNLMAWSWLRRVGRGTSPTGNQETSELVGLVPRPTLRGYATRYF